METVVVRSLRELMSVGKSAYASGNDVLLPSDCLVDLLDEVGIASGKGKLIRSEVSERLFTLIRKLDEVKDELDSLGYDIESGEAFGQ